MQKYKDLLGVGIFTLGYLLIAAYFSLNGENWEFLYYIVVVVVLAIAVLFLHKRVHLTQGVLWLLSIWALLHLLGGLLPVPEGWYINGDKRVLYSLWLIPDLIKYDHFVHGFGFAVATWVCWQALKAALPHVRPTFGILTLCALAGMGLGAINEIVEFIAVIMIPDTNVGGYTNTGWDLVANAVGCIVAVVIISAGTKRAA